MKYLSISIFILFFSCKNEKNDSFGPLIKEENIIEVTTTGMDFALDAELKSGWNTFKYNNNSGEVHFFILEKLPDSIRLKNYEEELIPVFKEGFNLALENKLEESKKSFEKIPAWFSKVELSGGVGLVSPNNSGTTSIYLAPGYYAMECYVRMSDGIAHVFHGMLKEIHVTDKKNNHEEPVANYNVSISSTEGIVCSDSITAGTRVFKVNFKDQKMYEHFMGHDVNLVKVDNNANIDELVTWLNVADLNTFRNPAPKGFTFLGGVEDLGNNKSGYFTANLTKGNYVLIAEIPDAKNRKMLFHFKVE